MPQINFYRLIARPKAGSPKAHKIKQYNGYFACYADEPNPFVTAMRVLDHDANAELLSMRLEETGDIDDILCHGGSRGRFDEYGPIWIMGVVVEFPKEL
jgi:hypothetical protein